MIARETLERLEAGVVAAMDGGSPETLAIIDYGEISTVLAAEGTDGPVVCKRLPGMTRSQLAHYEEVLADYLRLLGERGVDVAPSEVHIVGDDPVIPYCVQPRYERLLVEDLRSPHRALIERRFKPGQTVVVDAVVQEGGQILGGDTLSVRLLRNLSRALWATSVRLGRS